MDEIKRTSTAWTRLDVGDEVFIVLKAFSVEKPSDAEVLVRSDPWPTDDHSAGRLALRIVRQDRIATVFPLDRMSPEGESLVINAKHQSAIVVEEEPAGDRRRRFTYIANIRAADGVDRRPS